MNRFRPLSPLAAVLVFGALSLPAGAQEARSFVVTASRVSEEALEAPAQVSVLDAGDLAASGAANLVEALERLAGVAFRSTSGSAQAEITMRGFGENSSGRVLVLVDGRRLNNPDMQSINWLSIPLADVDRVEVLQGASAVRYGNNAVGGVVNVITKKAKKGVSYGVDLTGGTFGTSLEGYGARASVNVGGASGGFVVAAEYASSDGYRDRSGNRAANASLRGHFDLSESLTLRAGAAAGDVFFQMPGFLTEAQFLADPRQSVNPDDDTSERTYTAELGAEWTPFDLLYVELPLSYSYKDNRPNISSWGTYTDRTVHFLQASPTASWETALAELPLRVVFGADVSAAFLEAANYSDEDRTTRTNAFDISQVSTGPYLTARLTLPLAVSLEAGARWDRSIIAGTNVDATVDSSKTHQAFVYDAGLVYRPAKNAKLYARWGTLFRYPFTDEQTSFYGFGSDEFLTDLEAERGFNAEAGASLSLGGAGSLDFCAYWTELTDEIAYNDAAFRNENLDRTRRLGLDATLEARPAGFLWIKGTYGFVDAVFTDGANEGKRVPLVPAHRLRAELGLQAPFGLSVVPSAVYTGDAFQGGDTANAQAKIDAYVLFAVSARFVPAAFKGALEIFAEAGNLLDESVAPLQYYSAFSSTTGYYPAAGRSLTLGARYRR